MLQHRAGIVSMGDANAAAMTATQSVPANATVDSVISDFVHGLPGSVFHTRQWSRPNVTTRAYAAGEDTGLPWAHHQTVYCMRVATDNARPSWHSMHAQARLQPQHSPPRSMPTGTSSI